MEFLNRDGERGASPCSSTLFPFLHPFTRGYSIKRPDIGANFDTSCSSGEFLTREIEKQRLKEELLTREFLLRREIENEVRRELAAEWQLQLRGFPVCSQDAVCHAAGFVPKIQSKVHSNKESNAKPVVTFTFQSSSTEEGVLMVPSGKQVEHNDNNYLSPSSLQLKIGSVPKRVVTFASTSAAQSSKRTKQTEQVEAEVNCLPLLAAQSIMNNKQMVAISSSSSSGGILKIQSQEQGETKGKCLLQQYSLPTKPLQNPRLSNGNALQDITNKILAVSDLATCEASISKKGDVANGDLVCRSSIAAKSEVSGLKKKCSVEASEVSVLKKEHAVETVPVNGGNKVKKEWACDICKVAINSEAVWLSHVEGKKHKAKESRLLGHSASLPATDLLNVPEKPSELQADVPTLSSLKCSTKQGPNRENASGDEQLQKKAKVEQHCEYCDYVCLTERDMAIHLQGKKHKTRVARSKILQHCRRAGTTEQVAGATINDRSKILSSEVTTKAVLSASSVGDHV